MKIIDAKQLIDQAFDKIVNMLESEGIKITQNTYEEKNEADELSAIVGTLSLTAEGNENLEVILSAAACVEDNGEIDDEMLNTELRNLMNTAEDYKARLNAHADKSEALMEIDRLLTTGLDLAAEKRAADGRAKTYKVCTIVAAALMMASAIWLLIDMIIR
jgi:hypothetical protein